MKRILSVVIALAAVFTPITASGQATGVETKAVPFTAAQVGSMSGPTFDRSGNNIGQAEWRTIDGTGNCCENFIGISKEGRLYDLGGTFLRYSDDRGNTWWEIPSSVPVPLQPGEGALVMAPGGDVIGMSWEPYSGDRVITFKYERSTNKWLNSETPLHTPFFDRPWIAVIPGPFTVGAQTVPYISVMATNVVREVYYYSLDGLNYFVPSTRFLDQLGTVRTQALDLKRDPETDWIQPISEFGITPLPGGGALSRNNQAVRTGSEVLLMDPPDFSWSPLKFPQQQLPVGRTLADSSARLHHVSTTPGSASFSFMTSRDGGRTWSTLPISLPGGLLVEDWDFKVNGNLDTAVVGLHAERGSAAGPDQDLVYEIGLGSDAPFLRRYFFVGAGDQASERGLGHEIRFDFSTIGLFPDGSIVTTFLDSKHLFPALAVLVSAPTGSSAPSASPAPSAPPSQPPNPAPSVSPSPAPSPSEDQTSDDTAPQISGITDWPDPFSPNGDGRKDRVFITFNIDEDAIVKITIKRGKRTVRRLLPATDRLSGSWREMWNGRRNGGRKAKAGRYSYLIEAVDDSGNRSRASGSITLRRR